MEVEALRYTKSKSKIVFLSLLYATYIYYQGDITGAKSGITDLPGDSILSHYDFVIVGGGSAGKNNAIYLLFMLYYKITIW